jgi:hypothetical protein
MDYPPSLPCFLFQGYGVNPRSPVLEKDWGLDVRRRQIYSDMPEDLRVEVILSGLEWETFREFYAVDTEMGTLPFNAPILIEGALQTKEVRFTGPPPSYKPLGAGLTRATATLVTT